MKWFKLRVPPHRCREPRPYGSLAGLYGGSSITLLLKSLKSATKPAASHFGLRHHACGTEFCHDLLLVHTASIHVLADCFGLGKLASNGLACCLTRRLPLAATLAHIEPVLANSALRFQPFFGENRGLAEKRGGPVPGRSDSLRVYLFCRSFHRPLAWLDRSELSRPYPINWTKWSHFFRTERPTAIMLTTSETAPVCRP